MPATSSTLRICIKKSILYFTLFLIKLAPRLGARLFRARRGAPLARDGTPFLNSFEECGAGTWRPSGTGAAQNAAGIEARQFVIAFDERGAETGRPSGPGAARSAAGPVRQAISKFFRKSCRRDWTPLSSRCGRCRENEFHLKIDFDSIGFDSIQFNSIQFN